MGKLDMDPWFDRGQTLGVTSSNDVTGKIGTIREFVDKSPITGIVNSNAIVKCVAVKNTSGGALTPGTVVKFQATDLIGSVDGAAVVDSVRVGVVDEYLPAAGVAANDVFWVVIEGPTTAVSSGAISQAAFVSIATGAAVASVANKTFGFALAAAASNLVRMFVLGRHSTP